MSEFPLDPVLAKVVLSASLNYSCAQEALAIVAMLNVPNVFVRPRDSANAADDAKKKFAETHLSDPHQGTFNLAN